MKFAFVKAPKNYPIKLFPHTMPTQTAEILKIIDVYFDKFESEKNDKHILLKQIKSEPAELDSRRNFNGHLTASALILNSDRTKVLLIKHKKLGLLLQPGGHVDPNEDPLVACKREIFEELGLSNMRYLPLDINYLNLPIDIDTHYIPANIKKGEVEHYHHDFRYLFTCDETTNLTYSQEELDGFKWVDLKNIVNLSGADRIKGKIRALALDKSFEFFREFTNSEKTFKEIDIILVTHIVQNIPSFIDSLNNIGNVKIIIPKPNSIQQSVLNLLKDNYKFSALKKEQINLENYKVIKAELDINRKTIIVDIGGYFSQIINSLKNDYPDLLLGVVEDTENGIQKYEKIKLNVPVLSVARSELKENEDFLVGHSIAFSVDKLLRTKNKIFNYSKIGILGYGKVGKGISDYVQKHNNQPFVYDINPIRQISALNNECLIVDKEVILKSCDIIFCATGNKSLNINDLTKLKTNSYLASCTSSDDEFDFSGVESFFKIEKTSTEIYKYYNQDHNFHLLNNGNAVNFLDGGVLDNFIYLVQAEIIECIKLLKESNNDLDFKIHELDLKTKNSIANIWLKIFKVN